MPRSPAPLIPSQPPGSRATTPTTRLDDEGRLVDRGFAAAIERQTNSQPATVSKASRDKKSEAAPLPYSLAELQIDAGRRLGLNPQAVLDICQALYETHRLTTYPRSDCSYLPEGHLGQAADVVRADRRRRPAARCRGCGGGPRRPLSRLERRQGDGSPRDHPDAESLSSQPLSNDERNVYNLIARRYLAQFYPPQEFYQLEAELHVAGERFIAKGRQPIAPGWRRLYDSPADREDLDDKDPDAPPQDEDVDPGSPIPPLKPGQILRVARTRTVDKKTKPPRRFTAASLVQAMTGIARYVTNAQIKALLRESDGIGTPATQARIIQLLFDRGYVEEKKRLVYSTATGRALIKALPPVTTQPDMTALWESTLRKVQEGQAPLEGFLHAVRAQLGELVARAKSAGPLDLPGAETRPCRAPGCTGSLRKRSGKKGAFWACSRYPDCRETASTESSAGASGRRGGTRKCRR